MYQIDYTQDFSGVLDRKVLVLHLLANGFETQGSETHSEKGTILGNTSSVGEHVCTWMHEALDCPNQHLQRTFEHPAVREMSDLRS